jgi:hypothetical protein
VTAGFIRTSVVKMQYFIISQQKLRPEYLFGYPGYRMAEEVYMKHKWEWDWG